MASWAVVPLKPLVEAKTRLAPHLDVEHRMTLARDLADHVLGTLRAVRGLEGTLVVGRDETAFDLAGRHRAGAVAEAGPGGLNAAVGLGAKHAFALGADAVLVLAADLPFLTPGEVSDFLALGRRHAVVLAPDRWERGTNGLMIAAGIGMAFRFGPDSLSRHRDAARRQGIEPGIYRAHGLGFDIDTPEDLFNSRKQPGASPVATPLTPF